MISKVNFDIDIFDFHLNWIRLSENTPLSKIDFSPWCINNLISSTAKGSITAVQQDFAEFQIKSQQSIQE